MVAINNTDVEHSLDHIFNASFDKKYQMLGVELVAYDPITIDTPSALKRVTTHALGEYRLNDKTVDATVVYMGFEDANQDWIIIKRDDTNGTSLRYATVKNNLTKTTYSLAWADYESLTYDTYGASFLTASSSAQHQLAHRQVPVKAEVRQRLPRLVLVRARGLNVICNYT